MDMSRIDSSSSLHGFSVFQTAIGSTLQFIPALGTAELDIMIDSFVPGPGTLADKRAIISMDFCEFSMRTQETFKYYPLPAFTSDFFDVDSPTSSVAFPDSYYPFDAAASPVMPHLSWSQSSLASSTTTQSAASRRAQKKARTISSHKVAGITNTGFSHLPGMKIMTSDGQDVTNSASRGCKSREQRDHAHLMRILKACPDCKRKKVRCDPSHKKRLVSGTKTSELVASKGAKKAKTISSSAYAASSQDSMTRSSPTSTTESLFIFDPILDTVNHDHTCATDTDQWKQFINFDNDHDDAIPQGYEPIGDPARYLHPTISSRLSGIPITLTRTAQPVVYTTIRERNDVWNDDYFSERTSTSTSVLPYIDASNIGANYATLPLTSPQSAFFSVVRMQGEAQATVFDFIILTIAMITLPWLASLLLAHLGLAALIPLALKMGLAGGSYSNSCLSSSAPTSLRNGLVAGMSRTSLLVRSARYIGAAF